MTTFVIALFCLQTFGALCSLFKALKTSSFEYFIISLLNVGIAVWAAVVLGWIG